jgi:hypothetical protein
MKHLNGLGVKYYIVGATDKKTADFLSGQVKIWEGVCSGSSFDAPRHQHYQACCKYVFYYIMHHVESAYASH